MTSYGGTTRTEVKSARPVSSPIPPNFSSSRWTLMAISNGKRNSVYRSAQRTSLNAQPTNCGRSSTSPRPALLPWATPTQRNDENTFCKTNEALTWNGEEHVDRLVYLNGRTYVAAHDDLSSRNLTGAEDYTLLIGEEGWAKSYGVTDHQADTEDGSMF